MVGCVQESGVGCIVVRLDKRRLQRRRLPMRCCTIVEDSDLRVVLAMLVCVCKMRGCKARNMSSLVALPPRFGVVNKKPRQELPVPCLGPMVRELVSHGGWMETKPLRAMAPQIAPIYLQVWSRRRHAGWQVEHSAAAVC